MPIVSPLLPLHRAYLAGLAQPKDAGSTVALSIRGERPGAAVGSRQAVELETLPWGATDEHPEAVAEIIADFSEVEAEYAAIRRGAGLFDSPHRGTLIVTGPERIDFLNRMLTQEMKGMAAGQTREAFWLNRKGRIDADVFLIELGDRMLMDLDIANAAAAATSLNEFLFTEDVEIRNASGEFHHVAVHGAQAREVIAAATGNDSFDLGEHSAGTITIDGREVVIARRDQTGEAGFELIMQQADAAGVWEFLLAADHIVGEDKRRVRPIGWHAFNIARIEAGEILFNIDFGPTNLPHQVGELLSRRVSFTKGCYLGQEIVARMHSRGHSKPMLVGLRMSSDRLPIAGAQVFSKPVGSDEGGLGEPIGVITSSTLSPMLSALPIAFGMIRTTNAPIGAEVLVNAEGEQAPAIVSSLRMWHAASAATEGGQ